MLNHPFLLHSLTFNTFAPHVLGFPNFCRDKADVLLRSTGLERRLASLKVASMVFRTNEREDNDVGSHASDEDALNEGIIWYVFSSDRRAGVFPGSYGTDGRD